MKKNTIIAAMAAASALLLCASCQKQDLTEQNNEINAGGKVFTATIEQSLTKTTITNDYKVNWVTGDKVSINGAEYIATASTADPTKATLAASGNAAVKSDGKYKAIYPSTLYASDHLELPATQTYAAGQFNAPMYAESETEAFTFKNICGVLCLSLKGDSNDKIKYITVIANEGVCGKFTMGNDAATLSLSSTVGEYSRTVSLDCGEGVQLDNTTATDFYIYLPPNTYTAGMKIIITTTDSRVFENITNAPATIERNNIYTFNDWTLNFQPKPALLSGEFTVADGKTVQFTKGNLWADGSNALHFETNQWESVPTSDGSMDNSHVSHFTWSSTVEKAVGATHDGGNLFCDVSNKQTVDGQSNCYALSSGEWGHLFSNRTSAADKYGYATVNNVHGIIILPDTFNDPYAGIKAFNPKSTTGWDANEYSEAGWTAMESEGAVFLPAASLRYGSSVSDVGDSGYYWSSTARDGGAYSVYFYSDYVYPDNGAYSDDRNYGYSVRLITDASAAPAPTATKGTAKATINSNDVDVNWVQLWAGGPKFAEYNIGAASATDYGGYYCWGKSVDKDPNSDYNDGTDVLSGNDDTATKLWGSNWRMPTKAEFDALLANCTVEWTTVGGMNGCKFTGKGAYASNSVFLPAAGSCTYGSVSDQGDYGYYWSSAPDSSDYGDFAYSLYFISFTQYESSDNRKFGYSVRAVLAE